MKKVLLFLGVFLLVGGVLFMTKGHAEDHMIQADEALCRASDIASFKDCLAQAENNKTNFIKVTSLISCKTAADCSFTLSNVKNFLIIYGANVTDVGFSRMSSDYSLLTITDSEKVSFGGMLVTDSLDSSCAGNCPPLISIKNSKGVSIDNLNTKNIVGSVVMFDTSTKGKVSKSIFQNPYHAIVTANTTDMNITSNTFVNARSDAIVLSSKGKNTITQNIFKHNLRSSFDPSCIGCIGAQIVIGANSGDVYIEKNTISDGAVDIYGGFGLTTSAIEIGSNHISSVHISCNTISNNSGNGVVLSNRDTSVGSISVQNNTILNNGVNLNIQSAKNDTVGGNCSDAVCKVSGC